MPEKNKRIDKRHSRVLFCHIYGYQFPLPNSLFWNLLGGSFFMRPNVLFGFGSFVFLLQMMESLENVINKSCIVRREMKKRRKKRCFEKKALENMGILKKWSKNLKDFLF